MSASRFGIHPAVLAVLPGLRVVTPWHRDGPAGDRRPRRTGAAGPRRPPRLAGAGVHAGAAGVGHPRQQSPELAW